MDEGQRKNRRVCGGCEILVRKLSQHPFKADLLNISEEGACVVPPIRLSVGEMISVRLRNLSPFLARVIWVEGYKAGIRFDTPIHPSIFSSRFDDVENQKRGG